MPGMEHGAIHRSLEEMAYSLTGLITKKSREADAYKLAEVEMQYQIEIKGKAQDGGTWSTTTIIFEEVLHYAPYQRDNKNEDPQMVWGAVLDKGRAFISCHVEEWILDDNEHFSGAVVAIGIHDPSGGGSNIKGAVHVTFQGLGAPVELPGLDDIPA